MVPGAICSWAFVEASLQALDAIGSDRRAKHAKPHTKPGDTNDRSRTFCSVPHDLNAEIKSLFLIFQYCIKLLQYRTISSDDGRGVHLLQKAAHLVSHNFGDPFTIPPPSPRSFFCVS